AAGVLLDFDGSLADIVARPELAPPGDGAREVLVALVERYALVGILTGRRSDEIVAVLDVPGLRSYGLYGLEGNAPEPVTGVVRSVEAAATAIPRAWVEDKGVSIAVHYRQAPDPAAARSALLAALRPVAAGSGLELIEGKMVVELVPPGRPMKGGAIERLAGEHALQAVVYAGDDHADLDAFAALDRLRSGGLVTVKVAVRGVETPPALVHAANLVVEEPAGLVELLRQLA
ncbi:MAG TPA: trehalose-phosphatase, partial [Actinomycetota bacterium]